MINHSVSPVHQVTGVSRISTVRVNVVLPALTV